MIRNQKKRMVLISGNSRHESLIYQLTICVLLYDDYIEKCALHMQKKNSSSQLRFVRPISLLLATNWFNMIFFRQISVLFRFVTISKTISKSQNMCSITVYSYANLIIINKRSLVQCKLQPLYQSKADHTKSIQKLESGNQLSFRGLFYCYSKSAANGTQNDNTVFEQFVDVVVVLVHILSYLNIGIIHICFSEFSSVCVCVCV